MLLTNLISIGGIDLIMNAVEEKIQVILREVLGLGQEYKFSDLQIRGLRNWDSLKQMELIFSLEEKLGVEFDFKDIEAMSDYKSILSIVIDKIDLE